MPTPKKGRRLGNSAANQRKILADLAASLFEHGSIKTTDAKAKALRPYVEKLITKAKRGTLADLRQVARKVPNKAILQHLFDDLAPKFEGREGGYTRIVKLENRTGDNAPMSQISLVLDPVEAKKTSRADRVAASQQAEAAKSEEAEEADASAAESEDAEAEVEAEDAEKADEAVAEDAAEKSEDGSEAEQK
ncbi:50S ribosomal protein L17 [Corynebacterium atypicum]|uniref:Large ribosomal subunit protein bL17 n=1 Tax=Corynebacterium atypicum TaxID=191610 RepID=A0ABM5QLP1_9CORY|nr:50S ribosomal protein L17 [Corynebacterium atypicum]AIG63690.1 50S ribosomal protein L17 [Corynebacterium atypicum]